jgi:hypothetical protein
MVASSGTGEWAPTRSTRGPGLQSVAAATKDPGAKKKRYGGTHSGQRIAGGCSSRGDRSGSQRHPRFSKGQSRRTKGGGVSLDHHGFFYSGGLRRDRRCEPVSLDHHGGYHFNDQPLPD